MSRANSRRLSIISPSLSVVTNQQQFQIELAGKFMYLKEKPTKRNEISPQQLEAIINQRKKEYENSRKAKQIKLRSLETEISNRINSVTRDIQYHSRKRIPKLVQHADKIYESQLNNYKETTDSFEKFLQAFNHTSNQEKETRTICNSKSNSSSYFVAKDVLEKLSSIDNEIELEFQPDKIKIPFEMTHWGNLEFNGNIQHVEESEDEIEMYLENSNDSIIYEKKSGSNTKTVTERTNVNSENSLSSISAYSLNEGIASINNNALSSYTEIEMSNNESVEFSEQLSNCANKVVHRQNSASGASVVEINAPDDFFIALETEMSENNSRKKPSKRSKKTSLNNNKSNEIREDNIQIRVQENLCQICRKYEMKKRKFVHCCSCKRAFHKACLIPYQMQIKISWRCLLCLNKQEFMKSISHLRKEKKDCNKKINEYDLKKCEYILFKMYADPRFMRFHSTTKYLKTTSVSYSIRKSYKSLYTIKSSLKKYESVDQFIEDFNDLISNCALSNSDKKNGNLQVAQIMKKEFNRLIKYFFQNKKY